MEIFACFLFCDFDGTTSFAKASFLFIGLFLVSSVFFFCCSSSNLYGLLVKITVLPVLRLTDLLAEFEATFGIERTSFGEM